MIDLSILGWEKINIADNLSYWTQKVNEIDYLIITDKDKIVSVSKVS